MKNNEESEEDEDQRGVFLRGRSDRSTKKKEVVSSVFFG